MILFLFNFFQSTTEVFEEDIWPTLKPELRQGWGSCSPYTLALLVTSKRRFPKIIEDKFMQKHWGHADLLDVTNYHHIARIVAVSIETSLIDQISYSCFFIGKPFEVLQNAQYKQAYSVIMI